MSAQSLVPSIRSHAFVRSSIDADTGLAMTGEGEAPIVRWLNDAITITDAKRVIVIRISARLPQQTALDFAWMPLNDTREQDFDWR
jgi:hypothetical protein